MDGEAVRDMAITYLALATKPLERARPLGAPLRYANAQPVI
jgi:hypothetical protein